MSYKGYRDLIVYQKAYALAIELFIKSKGFPKEEQFSLTDQIRRSSRSIAANVAEGWKKRKYNRMFVSKLIDSSAEAAETEVWLEMCRDLGYLSDNDYQYFNQGYDEVSRMLSGMIEKSDRFCS